MYVPYNQQLIIITVYITKWELVKRGIRNNGITE